MESWTVSLHNMIKIAHIYITNYNYLCRVERKSKAGFKEVAVGEGSLNREWLIMNLTHPRSVFQVFAPLYKKNPKFFSFLQEVILANP